MDWQIPITEKQLADLSGQTIVVCKNIHGSSEYIKVSEKKVLAPGMVRGGKIKVEDGALCIYDADGLWARFDALEYNGASSYLRGMFLRQIEANAVGSQTATLHIKKTFGSTEFGVCISTCKEYSDFTMPKILKSLVNAKVSGERIVAVMGGHGIDSESVVGNIRTLTRIADETKFNGLMGVNDKYPYWLLLEDTTTVEPDIVDHIRELDIGLGPDIIRASDKTYMGLYSTGFVSRITPRFNMGVENAVKNGVRTCLVVAGDEVVSEPRNIYGKGVRRSTRTMPIGILKYDAKSLVRKP